MSAPGYSKLKSTTKRLPLFRPDFNQPHNIEEQKKTSQNRNMNTVKYQLVCSQRRTIVRLLVRSNKRAKVQANTEQEKESLAHRHKVQNATVLQPESGYFVRLHVFLH